jgi:phosphoribosylanthranilate isomerase
MTYIKICGITTLADFRAAIEAEADYIGFIFTAISPRRISRDQAMTLTEVMRGMDVPRVPQCIGVCVDPDPAEAVELLRSCRLQALQIHRADLAKQKEIHSLSAGAYYPVLQPQTLAEALASLAELRAANLLNQTPWLPELALDAYHPDKPGGTGEFLDLELAQAMAAQGLRLLLAGGLTPENVAEVVRTAKPWGVDVSRGVEIAPGKKDPDKIRAFIQAVRQADQESSQ